MREPALPPRTPGRIESAEPKESEGHVKNKRPCSVCVAIRDGHAGNNTIVTLALAKVRSVDKMIQEVCPRHRLEVDMSIGHCRQLLSAEPS
jgi:hypothetical protein